VYLLGAVKKVGGSLENAGANCGKNEMPCNEEYGIFEADGVVHVVVENNDRRGEDDPDRDNGRRRELVFRGCVGGFGGGR